MDKMSQRLPFCCPVCRGELTHESGSAKCERGHSFDRSKYGYYNLLLKNIGGVHGDNREMVLARTAFLASGHYRPLAAAISNAVTEYTQPRGKLLDVGCGEGYYTDIVERAMHERDGETRVFGFDISKDAARQIKKKNPRILSAVASAYDIPVSDGFCDTVLCAFSPLAREEIYRVLKPSGVFIMAIPEVNHLYELKSILYKTPYKNEVKDTALEGFELVSDRRISFLMKLSSEETLALFGMTPYAYRTPRESAMALGELGGLDCTADFHLYVYRKV